MYVYKHRVQFYETDEMGIVHHSNYLRFCEEARVAWAHSRGLIDYQKKGSAARFAVYETKVRHLKPAKFGDEVEVQLQVRSEGVRLHIQYRLNAHGQTLAVAETVHVSMDENLKLTRLPTEMKDILEKEKWTETWL
ncbi:acyl-CoA thioesterase [Bdellovibrio sp. HCB337]|uniref:acyl-CoA thioesterase n=1 Tax=Bdellovibrio sp. HCB337 TaxID=3394358 RepID=UPI0039A63BA5